MDLGDQTDNGVDLTIDVLRTGRARSHGLFAGSCNGTFWHEELDSATIDLTQTLSFRAKRSKNGEETAKSCREADLVVQ